MQNGKRLIWSLAGVALVAAPVAAQETKRLNARVTAEVLRDDNVARSNAVVAALRGVEPEDTIYRPTINVDIMQPIGRQALFLNGDVGYDFYQKNDQLNRERIALKGGAMAAFGPCLTTVTGAYDRRQSRLDDLAVGVTDNAETVTSASVDTVCGRQVGFVPALGVSQTWAENSSDLRSSADYDTTGASASLSYRRPTFGELSLFANYGKTNYDRLVPVAAAFERDGYESYGGGARYTRRIGSRLQGTVSAGYTSVTPSASNGDEFEGFTYGVDLTFKPTGRIETQANFARAVKPSNRLQTDYLVEEAYAIRGSYSIGSRLKFGLGASYTDSTFAGGPTTVGLVITDEQVRSIFASLRFNMSRRFAIVLDADQQERDANVPGFDYTANRVGVSFVATY